MDGRDIVFFFIVFFLVLLLGATISDSIPDDDDIRSKQQCDLWGIWHDERRAGVPIDKRFGWPDVDGRYYEECGGE